MRNDYRRYLLLFAILLFLSSSSIVACDMVETGPPIEPTPMPAPEPEPETEPEAELEFVPTRARTDEDEFAETIATRMGFNLEFAAAISEAYIPADKDIPFIYKYWLSHRDVDQGSSMLMIFRMSDEGMNFIYTQGLQISDQQGGVEFKINREGSGWYSCTLTIDNNATITQHTVTIVLTDTVGNSKQQKFEFQVTANANDNVEESANPNKAVLAAEQLDIVIPSAEQEVDRIWFYLERIDWYDQYGYAPTFPSISEMSELIKKARSKELSTTDYTYLSDLIVEKVYDSADYAKAYDKVVNSLATVEQVFPIFNEYNQKWEFKTFSHYTVVLTLYGTGGSYNCQTGNVVLKATPEGVFMRSPAGVIIHEMVHIGIEECIIQKYDIDQRVKERIVDLFVKEHFSSLVGNYVMQSIGNSSIDPYLSSEDAWENLPACIEEYKTR